MGKIAFERHCAQHNISVQHYRADNGIFASNSWRNACQRQQQQLTFTGVNAHHQNGIAERRIEELQAMARTMLIHAQRLWPNAIASNLWPYAIRMASDAMNATPRLQDSNHATPVELFAQTTVASNPKHWHHFAARFMSWQNHYKVALVFSTSGKSDPELDCIWAGPHRIHGK